MDDAGARRNHGKIGKRRLPPLQKRIALAVALELALDVLFDGVRRAGEIDHHRMVDHQVACRNRVDLFRIPAHVGHGLAHGGQVDHRRHAGEVLHQHPGRAEGDFVVGRAFFQPSGQRLGVIDGDGAPVLVAEKVLQQDLQRARQARHIAEARGLGRLEAEIIVFLAADAERAAGFKGVLTGDRQGLAPLGGGDYRGYSWTHHTFPPLSIIWPPPTH